jgi:cyanophycin synthetase
MSSAAESLVSIVPTWRIVPGHLHGLPQAGLAGVLQIRPATPDQLRQIGQTLRAFSSELSLVLRDEPSASDLARLFLHTLIACQRAGGIVVAQAVHVDPPATGPRGAQRCHVVMACPKRQAFQLALPFVLDIFNRPGIGTHAEKAKALKSALRDQVEPGQNTNLLLQAALDLDLPCTPIGPRTYRLGYGCRQQVLNSTATERTPYIGVSLARNKNATAALLRRHGLPAAEHAPVASADQAVATARQLGYPVVVKPIDRDGGSGVWADVQDDATVRTAFDLARRHSANVLVERHVPGTGHRLTVVMGRVVKITAKLPWGVTGDGNRSVQQLAQQQLEVEQETEARHPSPELDDEALGLLKQQGMSLHTVPSNGRFVPLRRRNNAIVGGSSRRIDPDRVHPDNLDLALRASQALMLDVAGIDLIVGDIGLSWMAQPASICDVNAIPQSDFKTLTALLSQLMGAGARVPVWLFLVPDGTAAPSDAQVMQLMCDTESDGLSCQWGVWLAGRRVAPALAGGFPAAEALLSSREVTRACIVMNVGEVARLGLPVDRFDRVCAGLNMQHLLDAVALPFNPAHTGTLRDTLAHAAAGWPRRDRDRLLALAVPLSPHATQHRRPKPAGPTAPFTAT